MSDAPVLIVGGGPVGMTLALALASHGTRSILVERNASTTRHPKMDLTNGRSMELFRRLGIADRLRAVGVPSDQPLDIVWATGPRGHVLHRFAYPSPDRRREEVRARNDGTQTLEPSMRVSQIVIEPELKAAIDENPLVDVRFGCAFTGLRQDEHGVTATVTRATDGATHEIRCDYLAGCDGGSSSVRTALGIGLEGQAKIANAFMIHFRSRAHDVLSRFGTAYHLQTDVGTLIAQDGAEIWTLQAVLVPDFDPDGVDPAELLRRWAGGAFDFEILVANAWSPHQLLAERYVDGRVALAGDSAHQVIPTGGYGMNTGIADAIDLGWKLSALVNGWGGPRLLESYASERRPIAARNREAAALHAGVRFEIASRIAKARGDGDLDAPAAEARRQALGAEIAALGNLENESWGIEHGYHYDSSPVICHEPGEAPPLDVDRCRPTTLPGARLPHLWLGDGSALYDRLGPELTLLVVGDADVTVFEREAARARIPLHVARLAPEPRLRLLERALLLVRPDHHVAWRGDAVPADCAAVLARATGH